MKKSLVVLGLLAVVSTVSAVQGKKHKKHTSERYTGPVLVALPYGDQIRVCSVIKHNGDTFTYNDSASQKKWGHSKTMKRFKGCELQCEVYIATGGTETTTLSIPIDQDDLSEAVQAALGGSSSVTLTHKKQLKGKLNIVHDALLFEPAN